MVLVVIIIVVVAALVFGPRRFALVGRSLGRSVREFKSAYGGRRSRRRELDR